MSRQLFVKHCDLCMRDTKHYSTGVCLSCVSKKGAEKAKEVWLKKYGVTSPLKLKENREKCKKALAKEEVKEKREKTCLEKYGVKNPSSSQKVKDKVAYTNLKRLGVKCPFQSDIVKEKIKSFNRDRYGSEWYCQTEEFKQKFRETCLEKYGVESPSSLREVQNKAKKTCLEKYGVEHFSQTTNFHKQHRSKVEIDGVTFDSEWELIFYRYFKGLGKTVIKSPTKFEYFDEDGTKHYYIPDFEVDGQLYEIKGDHFFEGEKLINPFDRSEKADDHNKRKYECMLEHNVKILKGDDITKLSQNI